jgi:glucan phosphoethanolaminetransferase (alkaline phosphatase superfamily)
MEAVIMFISSIIGLVKTYIFTVLPVLILISVMCVLMGMCIKSGVKGGIAIGIILLTMVIFIYVIYGKDALTVFSKIKDKISNTYFSNKSIFNNSSTQQTDSQKNE